MKDNFITTLLKGLLMGVANLVPGVSGGTIAFITGIFETLINSLSDLGTFVKEFLLKIIGKNNKKSFAKVFKHVNFKFFIPLCLGLFPATFLGAALMSNLIENYPAPVFSFFVGLILASAIIIYKKIEDRNIKGFLLAVIGFVTGILISLIPGSESSTPNIFFFLLVGAVSIIAMILPGISGAHITLMFGQLTFLYLAMAEFWIYWPFLIAFSIGSIIGLLAFSRLLSYLFKKFHSETLFVLTGLMLGAMYRPITEVTTTIKSSTILISAILLVVGFVIVLFIDKFAKKS